MAVVAGVELLLREAPSNGGRDGAGEAVVEEVDDAMGLSWRRTRWPREEREPQGSVMATTLPSSHLTAAQAVSPLSF